MNSLRNAAQIATLRKSLRARKLVPITVVDTAKPLEKIKQELTTTEREECELRTTREFDETKLQTLAHFLFDRNLFVHLISLDPSLLLEIEELRQYVNLFSPFAFTIQSLQDTSRIDSLACILEDNGFGVKLLIRTRPDFLLGSEPFYLNRPHIGINLDLTNGTTGLIIPQTAPPIMHVTISDLKQIAQFKEERFSYSEVLKYTVEK